MQTNRINNLSTFLLEWKNNNKYFEMLAMMASLSRLFSENNIPYLDYRLAENLFCRYYNAVNDARSCTAYDARLVGLGIGIKTFTLSKNGTSIEKIAEFNKLKKTLHNLKDIDLARKLAEYRNDRIRFANDLYDVTERQYHIVGRQERVLCIFNTPYDEIDLDHIHLDKDDETSCCFHDEQNEYTFNKSKSVLMKRFSISADYKTVNVNILEDPFELLERLLQPQKTEKENTTTSFDFVMLPLYSIKPKSHEKYVAEKSGLNQFNAGGRKRNQFEVYIPVPKHIHKLKPNFFPDRDTPFELTLPNGQSLSAKICQDGGKALMSNPNSALGEWLLDKVLKKAPWEIVTMEDLNRLGFDSVCIEKSHKTNEKGEQVFRLFFTDSYNFESFVGKQETITHQNFINQQ